MTSKLTSPRWRRMAKSLLLGATVAGSLVACASEPSFTPNDSSSEDAAKELSLRHVRQDATLLNGIDDVEVKRVFIDKHGRPHTTLQQTIRGIPVFGGESIVHLETNGRFRSFTDDFQRGARVDTSTNLSVSKAEELAVSRNGGWANVTGTPETDQQILIVKGQGVLTYRVAFDQFEDMSNAAQPVVFIDAKTGDTVMEYDNLKDTALSDDWGVTRDAEHTTNTKKPHPVADGTDSVAFDAHDNAKKALDYFWDAHGRNSYDGNGAVVNSFVHYGNNYVNAFWDGKSLTYGDGDLLVENPTDGGPYSGPLTTLDIVTHELSHGVCSYSADLVYQNESGALNEANSDIMAAAVEAADGAETEDIWLVGEDTWVYGDGFLRSMCDPAAADDIDYYWDRYTGTADNGGVHGNSGIANLFFCLLSNGGTHPRGKSSVSVTGIGIEAAADIWYQALTTEMTSSTDFAEAHTATLVAAAADSKYNNATTLQAIDDAWAAVGVGVPAPTYAPIHTFISLSGPLNDENHEYGPYSLGSLLALRIATSGGTGDVDLYVREGSAPTQTEFDCRPYATGNNETCTFADDGQYYIMLRGYAAYSGVTLSISSRDPATPPDTGCTVNGDCDTGYVCNAGSCEVEPECTVENVAIDCGGGYVCNAGSCEVEPECDVDNLCGDDSDGQFCTTNTCVNGFCIPAVPDANCCETGDSCNDNDACTTDSCSTNECSNTAITCIDGWVCDSNVGCVELPDTGGTCEALKDRPVDCPCDSPGQCSTGKCKGGPNNKHCK